MKNEIRITITDDGSVEIDLTRARGSVEDLKRLLKSLAGKLGPITKERHEPGHHHHHDGLHEHVTGS
jgi:hypothetical protein